MTERRGVRVGLFGGTLDPIHVGHLETARAAQRALGLDRLLVLPSRVPPHRASGPSASMFHRFAMAAMAIVDLPGAAVSDAELRIEGTSYTAETLDRLSREGLKASELFFITGADAFAEIESWHRFPGVLDLANFVVVSRPGLEASALRARLPQVAPRVRTPDTAGAAGPPAVFLVDAPTPDVSSTDIRRRLRDGERITGLVPAPVEDHISRHALYAEPGRPGSLA